MPRYRRGAWYTGSDTEGMDEPEFLSMSSAHQNRRRRHSVRLFAADVSSHPACPVRCDDDTG